MNPGMSRYDWLTFAHEFGHFCNDYASYGSYAGTDVLEVFSQGMEYLSLCYGEPTDDLIRMKMADSLSVYVEQSAFAAFEQQMYALPAPELTVEGLYTLYDKIAQEYGFESVGYDPREFVTIPHFYTNPMYVISYVVSNDAAMQLYQLEQENPGAGLERFQENLDTQETYFLAFLDAAGLENPLAPGRMEKVRETFEGFFG
jgi:oligoendopeptidase F